jgi:hypothetical protein
MPGSQQSQQAGNRKQRTGSKKPQAAWSAIKRVPSTGISSLANPRLCWGPLALEPLPEQPLVPAPKQQQTQRYLPSQP